MSSSLIQVDNVNVTISFLSSDADWISLPENHSERLTGVAACPMSMALARQGFALDIVHLAVESIEVQALGLSHYSSVSEALELCLSLFVEPHSNFPSFGVFPSKGDLILAGTVDGLGLRCFDIWFITEID